MYAERLAEAYAGRRVLVTGHTGFKGGWLALWLTQLEAKVTGYSLAPPTDPNLFETVGLADIIEHHEGDIRDLSRLSSTWREADPEIVFHLAAQPIVRESYRDPLGTVETNVLGTANVLELGRRSHRPVALVLITSDKCYENREWPYGYREMDRMGGHDVYSASKGASEILISAWRRSFAEDTRRLAIASVRAGNVVGGGDWAIDRIVPDCIRALSADEPIIVRNPDAVRPWQHVLEPLSGYLLLGSRLLNTDSRERAAYCDAWNFGPIAENACAVRDLVDAIVRNWGSGSWKDASDSDAPHESHVLQLSVDKARAELGWRPRWDLQMTIQQTVRWYRACQDRADMGDLCRRQILEYCREPARR